MFQRTASFVVIVIAIGGGHRTMWYQLPKARPRLALAHDEMRWLMHGFDSFFHHIFGWTGTFDEAGSWYGFWSGFAGGFGILTIVIIGYRKINCHTQKCWRIGHHDLVVKHSDTDPGTTYRVCRHCHPEIQGKRFSREELHQMHRDHVEGSTQ